MLQIFYRKCAIFFFRALLSSRKWFGILFPSIAVLRQRLNIVWLYSFGLRKRIAIFVGKKIGINICMMGKLRLTKEFRFEGAHALPNYDGLCRHIHGHSYILYVTIEGVPEQDRNSHKYGMIMDFKDLKAIVNEEVLNRFDHALVLRRDSPGVNELSEQYGNVMVVDFQPTCENLIAYFAECIGRRLSKGVKLYSLRLYETATSYVEWINE